MEGHLGCRQELLLLLPPPPHTLSLMHLTLRLANANGPVFPTLFTNFLIDFDHETS
jgi:hypothetical protein